MSTLGVFILLASQMRCGFTLGLLDAWPSMDPHSKLPARLCHVALSRLHVGGVYNTSHTLDTPWPKWCVKVPQTRCTYAP
ncbi:hypothetical protein DFH09DRAFT_1171455 [Mycena vulgaris]|nr:hypothetical protein DFH09DRAFT_1171455 [Mycena vulgaris]